MSLDPQYTGSGGGLYPASSQSVAPTPLGGNKIGAVPGSIGLEIAPRRNTIVLFGDSMTVQNTQAVGQLSGSGDRGYYTWASAYTGQRLRLLANLGANGETTTMMLARIRTVTAYSPSYVSVLGGYNDLNNDTSNSVSTMFDLVTGNLRTIYKTLLAAGSAVVAMTILPGANLSANSAKLGALLAINRWIREFAANNDGVILVDSFEVLVDPTSATAAPATGVLYDSPATHPSTKGAKLVGAAWAAAVSPYVKTVGIGTGVGGLASNANPYGNLVDNPTMQGTGGLHSEFNGEAITATAIADNWRIYVDGHSSTAATYSKEARTDLSGAGWEWQKVDVTNFGSSGNRTFQIYCSGLVTPTTEWAAGDKVFALVELDLTAGSANINKLRASLILQNSSYTQIAGVSEASSNVENDGGIGSTGTIWLRTGSATLVANGAGAAQLNNIFLGIYMVASSSAAATLRIGRTVLCKELPPSLLS